MSHFCGLCGVGIHGYPFKRGSGVYCYGCIGIVEDQEYRQNVGEFDSWLYAKPSQDESDDSKARQVADDFVDVARRSRHTRGLIYHLFEDASESANYSGDRRTFGVSWSAKIGDVWEPPKSAIEKDADRLIELASAADTVESLRIENERLLAREMKRIHSAHERFVAERVRANKRQIFFIQRRAEADSFAAIKQRIARKVKAREKAAAKDAALRAFGASLFGARPVRSQSHAPNAKLTVTDVIAIRRIYDSGLSSQQRIAKQFGVSYATVAQVVHRDTWRNVSA